MIFIGALQAQEPVITPDTPVRSTVLEEWLHSGDPRLMAWVADFARRNHDAEVVAEMPALLNEAESGAGTAWPSSSHFGNAETQEARRSAVLAVLDTLIQENFPTPILAIESIAASFPAQAVILIAAHPLWESRNTLQRWLPGTTGDAVTGRELARIAAMMLAKDAKSNTASLDPGAVSFVAGIVAAAENQLEVTVTEKNGIGRGIGGSCCGDSFARSPNPGWPDVYFYTLEEHFSDLERANQDESSPLVVELDDDRIVARRRKEGSGWGSCLGIEPLDSSTRHRLVAYWLGVHDGEMSWHAIDNFTIVWTNVADYNLRLGEIVEAQRRKLRDTVEQLRQQGLLSDEEANQITPKLILKIDCEIQPCPI